MKFYYKLVQFESTTRRTKYSNIELQALLDYMLHNVYLVSEFTEKDALVCVKERIIEEDKKYTLNEACYLDFSNIFIALEFNEVSAAKKTYNDLLKNYDSASETEKGKMYDDVILSYDTIKYVEKQNS